MGINSGVLPVWFECLSELSFPAGAHSLRLGNNQEANNKSMKWHCLQFNTDKLGVVDYVVIYGLAIALYYIIAFSRS